jgi:hypothetical protein
MIKRGYRPDIDPQMIHPDDEGIINIEIKELERVEIRLEGTMGLAPLSLSNYSGFLVIEDRLRSLPIGATLDTKNGIFSWQPGPGLYGTYEFVFLKADGIDGRKVKLRVKILTKYIKEILEVKKMRR